MVKNLIVEKQLKHISKYISLLLRHQPDLIGLTLDENGWADVQELITKMNEAGTEINVELLLSVVETNDKKRFALNEDKTAIRASQGHSIEVELNLQETIAPDILFHGTADRFVPAILAEGLKKQERRHVHLSSQMETAKAVGSRHGKPVILNINARAMQADGFIFYLSENSVWLVDNVPVKYIST